MQKIAWNAIIPVLNVLVNYCAQIVVYLNTE